MKRNTRPRGQVGGRGAGGRRRDNPFNDTFPAYDARNSYAPCHSGRRLSWELLLYSMLRDYRQCPKRGVTCSQRSARISGSLYERGLVLVISTAFR